MFRQLAPEPGRCPVSRELPRQGGNCSCKETQGDVSPLCAATLPWAMESWPCRPRLADIVVAILQQHSPRLADNWRTVFQRTIFAPYWVPYLSGRGLRTLAYPHPLPERRGFRTAACGQIPCGLSTLRLAIGGVSITEHISFVVFHPILFEKSEVFFGKCHFSVMLLLVPDILNCVLHHRLTYGKHGLSALPFKMGICRRNGLYPSAAVPLHILDHF